MQAIRVHACGDPEVMKLEEVPDPVAGAGEVVVRVRAVGVNPVDTYFRSGAYTIQANLPYTPGIDGAGVIESVGPGLPGVRVGDRVYLSGARSGTYAQKALCTANQVHLLPDTLTFAQGAAVHVNYATAYRALFQRGQARPGDTVLVHGASGGVGIAALQFARMHGLHAAGSASTDAGQRLVRDHGAELVVNHKSPDHLQAVMDWTGGRGVDLILEMLANVNLADDLPVLAPRGRVLVIGSRGKIEIDPRWTMTRESDIRGVRLLNLSDHELAEIHAAVGAGLASGQLLPVVGRELPLGQAPLAHRQIMEAPAAGKIVLIP